jgi:integrase
VRRQGTKRDGRWIALWAKSIDPARRNVTPGVTYATEAEAEDALSTAVAKYENDPASFEHLKQPEPTKTTNDPPNRRAVNTRAPRTPRPRLDFSDGSVKKLPSGRFRAQFPRHINPDERNVTPGITYASKEEAQKVLRDNLILFHSQPELFVFQTDDDDDAPKRTLAYITAEFLRTDAADLSPSTVNSYRTGRRIVCNPKYGLGNELATELTAGALYRWQKSDLVEAGLTSHTIRSAYRFLSSVLSREVELGELPMNPALGSPTRRRASATAAAKPPRQVEIPSWEEEMGLVLAVPTEAERLLLLTLIWAGPRLGEAASILPQRLSANSNEIYIDRKWQRRTGVGWEERPLKTGEARDLLVPLGLMKALVDWRNNRRVPPSGDRKNVLFPYVSESGTSQRRGVGIWESKSWGKGVMSPARDAVGLPKLRTKDLRESAASNFHAAGYSDMEAQRHLGHTSISTTRRHYIRATQSAPTPEWERIRLNTRLTPQKRLNKMWDAWLAQCGEDPTAGF